VALTETHLWALASYKVLVAQTLDIHGDEDTLDYDATDGLGASAAVFEVGQIAEGVNNSTDFLHSTRAGWVEIVAEPVIQGRVQQG
jgi:hypothetical protein